MHLYILYTNQVTDLDNYCIQIQLFASSHYLDKYNRRPRKCASP